MYYISQFLVIQIIPEYNISVPAGGEPTCMYVLQQPAPGKHDSILVSKARTLGNVVWKTAQWPREAAWSLWDQGSLRAYGSFKEVNQERKVKTSHKASE